MEFNLSIRTGRDKKKDAGIRDPQKGPVRTPDFIPYSNMLSLNGLTQNNDLLLYLYNTVAEVNSIISYIAQVAADIEIKHIRYDRTGKDIDLGDTWATRLLENPNPKTTGKIFRSNAFAAFFVFGNIYLNKILPVGFKEYKELYLLPSNRIWVITEKSIGDYGQLLGDYDPRLNEIIKYNWKINQKLIVLDPSEVIHIKDSNLSTDNGAYLYGQSRLLSASRTIDSLSNMVDTINTILSKNGGLGFIKKRKRAQEVDSAMDPVEKEKIEANFQMYGLTDGRAPLFFTDQDLEYVRMMSALSDFMPVELKAADFRLLCNVLGGFPSVILNDPTSSTYNNISTAEKALYMNIAKPIVNLFYESLSQGLGLTAMNEQLEPDYSEIEVLQPDRKILADTQKVSDEVWMNRYKNQLITKNQMLEAMGLPSVAGGDSLYEPVQINIIPDGQANS